MPHYLFDLVTRTVSSTVPADAEALAELPEPLLLAAFLSPLCERGLQLLVLTGGDEVFRVFQKLLEFGFAQVLFALRNSFVHDHLEITLTLDFQSFRNLANFGLRFRRAEFWLASFDETVRSDLRSVSGKLDTLVPHRLSRFEVRKAMRSLYRMKAAHQVFSRTTWSERSRRGT